MNNIGSVAIFSAYYPPHTGGVERYARTLAINLIGRGVKTYVITSATGANTGIEDDCGITVVRLPVWDIIGGRYPVIKRNSRAAELRKYINSLDCDVYVSNMRIYHLTLLAAYIAGRMGKPHILIEHVTGHFSVNNHVMDCAGRIFEHLVTNVVRKRTTAFYGVSSACTSWLGHFGILAGGIIPNGVADPGYEYSSMRDELGIAGDKIIITYAGRIIEEKGIKILIDAYKRFSLNFKDSVFVIAGEGKLANYIREESKRIGSGIVFAGALEHRKAVNLLKDSDIVVNPSYYPEGLPTLLLEAGLYNCAVIATDSGGTRELIINGETGILINPKDEVALLEALQKLTVDSQMRVELAVNLKNRVTVEYSWDSITELFLNEMSRYV